MKKPIKINFTDFWPSFQSSNNYLYNKLSKFFELEISENPDFLFFSCYSNNHLNYNCTKIEFLAENQRPNFILADYSISFDYLNNERHLRLPLYVFYFDDTYTIEKLLSPITDDDAIGLLNKKKEFCCFLVSNPNADQRINFFHQLSKYKKVDSGGRVLNNIGGPVNNKLKFIKDYKFVISFENSSYPGYTTEKVLQPKHVNSIPIYWGNPLISKEMNPKSFVNYYDFNSFDALIDQVISLDNNDELYLNHLKAPLFYDARPNEYFDDERLVLFFEQIFSSKKKKISYSIPYKFAKAERKIMEVLNKINHRITRS